MSKIAAKLVEAMKAIDAIAKRGRNQQQSYDYVKAADVANEVRKSLNAAGIAFTYSVLSERTWEGTTKSNNTQYFCSLLIEVSFTDSESGEMIKAQAIGWGADTQDKAPYKAMTGALKYALRMNFLIPDELDPEESEAHETVASPKPAAVIAKSEADKLRKALTEANIPTADIRGILDKYGFATCNHITKDKATAIMLEFSNLLDFAKEQASQGAAAN